MTAGHYCPVLVGWCKGPIHPLWQASPLPPAHTPPCGPQRALPKARPGLRLHGLPPHRKGPSHEAAFPGVSVPRDCKPSSPYASPRSSAMAIYVPSDRQASCPLPGPWPEVLKAHAGGGLLSVPPHRESAQGNFALHQHIFAITGHRYRGLTTTTWQRLPTQAPPSHIPFVVGLTGKQAA